MSTWLNEFPKEPYKKYSQSGEEGIILHILAHISPVTKYLIDCGSGDGYQLSNARYFLDTGWSGVLYDGREEPAAGVTRAWITPESIPGLLKGHEDCSLFLLDIDSQEYFVLREALKHINPAIIVCEFNKALPPGAAMTVPYDPTFVHDGSYWYGCSLEAIKKVGAEYGYSLVHQHANLNAFLVKSDLLPEAPPEVTYEQGYDHPWKPDCQWVLV